RKKVTPSAAPQQSISAPRSDNSAASFANPEPKFSTPSLTAASPSSVSASSSSDSSVSFGNPGPQFLAPPAKTPLVRRSLAQPILPAEAEKIKQQLAPLILQHWNEFSEPLQQHILYCKRGNLQSKFDMLQTVNFRDAFISPVGWGLVRDIPVRLPRSDRAENKKYYNLLELLELPQRMDPNANIPFGLNEIRPAPEVLAELKQHTPAVSSKTGLHK
ncbi:MAG: hypothetical protein K2Q33_09200, partial [Gammaproteobacteria bacterium]|nr:hypothetical protein [Gammaproteobacteria bacterium]